MIEYEKWAIILPMFGIDGSLLSHIIYFQTTIIHRMDMRLIGVMMNLSMFHRRVLLQLNRLQTRCLFVIFAM